MEEVPEQPDTRSDHRRAPWWIALVPAVAGFVICLLQLRVGTHWAGVEGYDDGVYVGSAVELAHGVLPYRDYVYVQPPGLTLLLTPLAFLFRLIGLGSQDVLAASRLLTAVVTGGCAGLAALVVRFRGAVAMFVAGAALCCFPAASMADSTAFLEPYVVFCCLLGVLCCFSSGRVGPRSRLFLGGLAFGIGSDFKLWALLPAGIACLFVLAREWRWAIRFVAGVAVGLLAVVGPFLALAPSAFYHDTFQSQVARLTFGGVGEMTIHFNWLLGLEPLNLQWWEAGIGLIAVVIVVTLAWQRSVPNVPIAPLEVYVACVGTSVVIVLVFVNPFYPHYAYFLAPWLAIIGGLVVARACEQKPLASGAGAAAHRARGTDRNLVRGALVAVVLTVLLGTFASIESFRHFPSTGDSVGASATLAAIERLPADACLTTDETSYLVVANRLANRPHGCPLIVDPFGVKLEEQAVTSGAGLRRENRVLSAEWRQWFKESDFVELTRDFRVRMLWNGPLRKWFHYRFALVSSDKGGVLYGRVRSPIYAQLKQRRRR